MAGPDGRNDGATAAGLSLRRRIRHRWQRWNAATETWRGGMALGVATALTIWVVWYFTKPPCTPDNVADGLCNGGWLARYINAEILALAGGAGIAVATLKGGFDTYMLKDMLRQEREARQRAEQELATERAERKARRDQEEQELHELMKDRVARQTQAELELAQERAARQTEKEDLRNELREELREEFRKFSEQYRQAEQEERRLADERRRQAEEERRQADEQRQQAEQAERRQTMALQQAMLDTIVQLAQQRDGNGNGGGGGNGRAAAE